ncbi:MAG: hypothetical protein M3067_08810 [Chloroflexota bacterium]|nr:hypothetical protein [Chloroflexota bacterium]
MTESSSPHPNEPKPGKATGDSGDFSSPNDSASDTARNANAREWLSQLQSMIDNITTSAAPVVREIGAKAAELAALAGEKAGPFAHRAADATAQAGVKVAERGREVAAELRRDAAKAGETSSNGGSAKPTSSGGSTATKVASAPVDSADSLGE